jgi:aminoglycoside/choline kinase family phosphotransferase
MTQTPAEVLLDWCASTLGERGLALHPVAGDASFRRYYRLVGSRPSRIAVHAPPDKEKNLEFTRIAALLREAGVRAPRVYAHDEPRGLLLIEDFGDRLLRPALREDTVDALYERALATLLDIQRASTATGEGWEVPAYSRAQLEQEMRLFPQWFLEGLLGLGLGAAERELIDMVFARLCDEALAQPQVLVHRDFHSRNLMLLDDGSLGVIDFQDAVRGPLTYDLVSLLRDCYVAWEPGRVRRWALDYAARAQRAGLLPALEAGRFLRWFDWMGLQRHIKVLGIFCRLWYRDGKAGYLDDLPLVWRYTREVGRLYPQTAPLVALIERALGERDIRVPRA